MHYTTPIYRPPYEANSLLLEVTSGCSHNSCSFCTMHRGIRFRMAPLEQVEADLAEARRYHPQTDRVFLLSGNAFALDYSHLKRIILMIHEYLPWVKTISMFARVTDIRNKTVEEIRELVRLGVCDIYVGTESGSNEVLAFANKGFTWEEAAEQLHKFEAAGMSYIVTYITGLAGSGRGEENALESAKFFNLLHPVHIGVSSLYIAPDTPYDRMLRAGTFADATELERLKETRTLLANLTAETEFHSIHVTNMVNLLGVLPRDKARLLAKLDPVIQRIEESGVIPVHHRYGM